MAASSSTVKNKFNGKKETNVVYGQKGRTRGNHNPSVGVVLISNPAPIQQQQQGNQHRSDAPRRHFTKKISMPLPQALQHLLKAELITLMDPS